MERLKTAQPDRKPGLLSLGVNSVYELQAISANNISDSTRPTSTMASQISNFQIRENAVETKPFKTFYTSTEEIDEERKVKFERINKFSGKSSYLSYKPARKNVDEQIMETKWFEY